jgi:two-component system, NarL family, nitrate/nitrite response regulator NarL
MTRIMIVDDHAVFRAGLAAVIKTIPRFELVAEADTCASAIELARRFLPDVVTMDINLPDDSGLNCITGIHQYLPDTKALVLTVSGNDDDLITAFKAGARGYVLKDVSMDALVTALNSVAAGEVVISPGMASRLLEELQAPNGAARPEPQSGISTREREVLVMVAGGYGNKEIGSKLFISESTVKAHLRSILWKLNVRNRAQAVAVATAQGILKGV